MMDINYNIVHFITSNEVRKSSVCVCFVTGLKGREDKTHRGIPYGTTLPHLEELPATVSYPEISDCIIFHVIQR